MKYIAKIINWIRKETWWRQHYKRITLNGKTTYDGRCAICDAGFHESLLPKCDSLNGKECPCKINQCLIRRKINV